jgi:hypothetical protein
VASDRPPALGRRPSLTRPDPAQRGERALGGEVQDLLPVVAERVEQPSRAPRADVAHGEQVGRRVLGDQATVGAVGEAGRPARPNRPAAGPMITGASPAVSSGRTHPAMAVRLHVTHIPELDRLIALEYGRVDEGQPVGCWRPVGRDVGYLHDGPLGPELGFKVLAVSRLDLDAGELGELWGAPCFDVPILGLNVAPAGRSFWPPARCSVRDRRSAEPASRARSKHPARRSSCGGVAGRRGT